MKLCIWYEPFDCDVSSGTIHAAHQWHELCVAFGVTHLAVINKSGEDFPQINGGVKVREVVGTYELYGPKVAIEQGDHPNHRGTMFRDDAWIIIGGHQGLSHIDADFYTIPTQVALYPREAAAIVLENQWQLRL